jgi:hypothetical protein
MEYQITLDSTSSKTSITENKKSLSQSGKAFSFTFQPKNKTCVLLGSKVSLDSRSRKSESLKTSVSEYNLPFTSANDSNEAANGGFFSFNFVPSFSEFRPD